MNTHGLVSVVIPVYNGAAYLAEAIQSVLDQDYPNLEIVAIDDGSTDDSPEILARFGDRVRTIRQANAGVGAARNAGIADARGEFVGFLDQDDYWRPEKVSRQMAGFRASGRVGLVHTDYTFLDVGSGFIENPDPPSRMVGDCFESLLLSNPLCNSSVMVRRSVLDAVGPCDPRIRGNTVQDYDLWLRVSRVSHLDFVPEPLTVFRLHEGQGHRDRRAMLTEELRVLFLLRPEAEWRDRPERRQRLARLYDELATACMDSDDCDLARFYFGKALIASPSLRQVYRYTASRLPSTWVQFVRRTRARRREKAAELDRAS